jgi:hypothetical protein
MKKSSFKINLTPFPCPLESGDRSMIVIGTIID